MSQLISVCSVRSLRIIWYTKALNLKILSGNKYYHIQQISVIKLAITLAILWEMNNIFIITIINFSYNFIIKFIMTVIIIQKR